MESINSMKENHSGKTNYLTHNFHTYPAKYIPQIPRTFILEYTEQNDVVYDPFLGCGTTLVECVLLNRNGIGVDSNPIATLISEAKTTKLKSKEILEISKFINEIESSIDDDFYSNYEHLNTTNFDNKDHWFQLNVQIELSFIKERINQQKNKKIKTFLSVCFSSIIVEVSNQESDTRYAAKNKNITNFRTIEIFVKRGLSMVDRIREFSLEKGDSEILIKTQSSEIVDFIDSNSVDLVITSPPYANTYDYYLYHKSRMNWLQFDVKEVQKTEIGSRDKHSSKKLPIDNFISSLKCCFKEVSRVLKPGKHAVIVIGDSVIRGEFFNAKEFTTSIFNDLKMDLVDFSSQNLKENTRMFNPTFTNSLKNEHVLIFKKN
jgi:site-specific DNA-methyltransferase (cytosine-N4-specific)